MKTATTRDDRPEYDPHREVPPDNARRAGPRLEAIEVKVIRHDGSHKLILRKRGWTPAIRRLLLAESSTVATVELIRRLTIQEYDRLREARRDVNPRAITPRPRAKPPRPSEPRPRDVRYAACEIIATFSDGTSSRVIVRRASGRRQIRQFEARPGIQSVVIARRLTMDEYRAFRREFPLKQYQRDR